MNKNKILYSILLLLVVLSSCDYENPLDKEQYQKTLYLIGASSNLVTKELSYSSEEQEMFITVGLSGSLLTDRNVDVNLTNKNSVINWYNKKFKFLSTDLKYQPLASNYYNVPSYTTTLKAGESYARLPIHVRTQGLECDSLYALTFKIDSSSDYDINRKDSALIVTFKLVNNYSGNYIFKGLRHELGENDAIVASAAITVLRTLKATDENSVRFYHEQQSETVANIKDYGVVMSLDANNNVTVSAWDNFDLISATCTYHKENKVFNIDYKYNLGGKRYQMIGTFTNQETK